MKVRFEPQSILFSDGTKLGSATGARDSVGVAAKGERNAQHLAVEKAPEAAVEAERLAAAREAAKRPIGG
jgi:hypothetical protein